MKNLEMRIQPIMIQKLYQPKKEYLMKQRENAEQNGVWAGYLEINKAGILLNANIRLYTLHTNLQTMQ